MKKHPETKQLEYNYITDGIFLGTNGCCEAHFDEGLAKKGITADISLEGERVDGAMGVSSYLWLPVPDQTAPSQNQLRLGVTTIKKLVAMKEKVYVHCQNGHGRAPTLVTAYLICEGMSVEEALDFIKEKRPSMHLQDVQIEALKKFDCNSE
jgi:hypothetical protein